MEALSIRFEIMTHIFYLIISIGMTLWVARRLFANGRCWGEAVCR